MKAIIFDTETTGLEVGVDRIIEAAYLVLDDAFVIIDKFHSYYDPMMPIGLGAMATHNIVDSDLVGCKPWTDFVLPDTEYVIGHNIDFDMRMIGHEDNEDIKRIDTLALARHWLPDIGTHKQSVLMYHFLGEDARGLLKDAHSALADVCNCRRVLGCIQNAITVKGVDVSTFELLWQESERSRIPTKMNFGKHTGMLIKDLPWSYKSWLLAQDWTDKYLRAAVNASVN